jgi:nickel-dependent lactate racemase
VVDKIINKERGLSDTELREILAEGLGRLDLESRRVLVVIPDGTRTAPIGLFFGLLGDLLGSKVEALDYLIALGTHPPMDDAATLGTIPASEVSAATDGKLEIDIAVRLNQLVGDAEGNMPYDHILVCGPVFPHEVAGFSGGNKYFVPGVAGQEVIDATHWVGALVTSRSLIGVRETPVRRLIERAASFIPTPSSLIALVMHGQELHGVFVGDMVEAWRAATELSAELDIVWVDRPFKRVLSVMPEMYDDLWTGAKGMYKLEPAVADGGEVVIYAPHITEVSYVHGRHLDQIGYHVRDYFVAQWEKFEHIPWGVLAHSTHLRGDGTYIAGVEEPRIRVTLATGIPRERCEAIGLGFLDPVRVELEEWADREDEGILLVRRAGEQLYRVKGDD